MSELELQDQTPPTNELAMQSSLSKVEVKVEAMLGTLECVASNSKQSLKSLKALEYLRLSKCCFLAKELHEEYRLCLEGKLSKELSDKDIPDEEWLSVFKCMHKKSTKLFLNHVRDRLINKCRLLYQNVYQATPSNGELLAKFSWGFVYERCPATASDPIGHWIAWARFGDSVLENYKMQKGETNVDKSSHLPELHENNTELLELDENNIELFEGFEHGKVVVKSGDRVEDLEVEPFVVENHGKETIGHDSSKLSTDNLEDNEVHICSVSFLCGFLDAIVKIKVIGNVRHPHCAQEDLGQPDWEAPLLTQFCVPQLLKDKRPTLNSNITDLLIVTHNKREGPGPPNVDMMHSWKVKQDNNLNHYVYHFAEWFVLGASQIIEVYIWNTSPYQDLEKRLELCLPQARRCLNGWIAKEACSTSSWLDEQWDQMLFLILGTFWKEFSQFNEDNTLLLDDKYLRRCLNDEDSYVILPSLGN
ncbi:hypothetical protein L7F22_008451 [Adiantum nelumboides]|nr:hypothetical protein [Adiantum nelumboides]